MNARTEIEPHRHHQECIITSEISPSLHKSHSHARDTWEQRAGNIQLLRNNRNVIEKNNKSIRRA